MLFLLKPIVLASNNNKYRNCNYSDNRKHTCKNSSTQSIKVKPYRNQYDCPKTDWKQLELNLIRLKKLNLINIDLEDINIENNLK